jgi:hypothetical protein
LFINQAEENKKMVYKNTIFAGAGLFSVLFAVLLLSGIVSLPNFANASETVSVSATIEEWVSFAVSPTTTDLGTLVDASGNVSIGSATSSLTLSSNSSDGYSVTIEGTNGGLNGSNGGTIATPAAAATTTCSAAGDGTDAYGAQATSTTLTILSPFNVSGDVVGSVAASSQNLLSSAYSTSSQSAILTVKASANKFDKNGAYTDTLTLTALPSVP